MFRLSALLFALSLSWSAPSFAADTKIATVDFQRALNEVKEGEAAQKKLEDMFAAKRDAIEKMGRELEAMQAEYSKQALILSEAARTAKEQELMAAQAQYQQAYMQSEGEMQEIYASLMEDLITRMRTISEQIGAEKGYGLVLEVTEGGVVYAGGVTDITAELIMRYDALSSK